jgi:hypothetical protein
MDEVERLLAKNESQQYPIYKLWNKWEQNYPDILQDVWKY